MYASVIGDKELRGEKFPTLNPKQKGDGLVLDFEFKVSDFFRVSSLRLVI